MKKGARDVSFVRITRKKSVKGEIYIVPELPNDGVL